MKQILREVATVLLGVDNWIDFKPMEHPAILPQLFVLDIVGGDAPGTCRLKVRLTGTKLDVLFGKSTKDHLLDEFVHGPRGHDVMQKFRECALTGSAIWMQQIVCFPDKSARYVEGVAIRIEPARIYGGLVSGEYSFSNENRFRWLPLEQALLEQDQMSA